MLPLVFLSMLALALPAPGDERAKLVAEVEAIEADIEAGAFARAEQRMLRDGFPSRLRRRLGAQLRLREGRTEEAVALLRAVLADEPGDDMVRLYLATALLELDRPAEALKALPASSALAEPASEAPPSASHATGPPPPGDVPLAAPLLRARALAGTGDVERAMAVLDRAAAAFPEAAEPHVEAALLASTSGSVARALHHAQLLLVAHGHHDGVVLVAQRLYDQPAALPWLEAANAAWPHDPELLLLLAHAWSAAGAPTAAAACFLELDRVAPGSATWEAAEQLMRAGDLDRALAVNARIADPQRRLPQRVRILFAAERMARVVALEPSLEALGTVEPSLRYRLAFAHYVLAEPARAATWARTLLGTELEGAARTLLEGLGLPADPSAP